MSAHPLGIISQAGDGARMTKSPRVTEGCSGTEGVVGGVASTAHHALYSAPPHRHTVFFQSIVFRDVGSGAVTTNLGFQRGVPKLFGLSAPVYARTVPAGAPNTAATAAAHARSAPRVGEKPLFETNAFPTMRPGLGRKVMLHQSQMPWLVPASRAALNTARWFTRGRQHQ